MMSELITRNEALARDAWLFHMAYHPFKDEMYHFFLNLPTRCISLFGFFNASPRDARLDKGRCRHRRYSVYSLQAGFY